MLKIFFKMKAQYIKTEMEYPINFWLMLFSGVLTRLFSLAIPFVIYQNIPNISGWQVEEIYLMICYLFIAEGLCSILFEGTWKIPEMVFEGQFDTILSRPVSPLFQVLSYGMGLQGIGVVLFGIVSLNIFLISLGYFSIKTIILSTFFIVSGTIICLSIYLISCSVVFWFDSGGSTSFPYAINCLSQYARYPVSIYPKVIRIVLLFIVPYSFIGEVPVRILRGENIILYTFALLTISILFLFLATKFFYYAIRKYESMGM